MLQKQQMGVAGANGNPGLLEPFVVVDKPKWIFTELFVLILVYHALYI